MGGSKTYPYGSTARMRENVLAALGVLKVATADQMWRLTCPAAKDNKAIRNACLDLKKHRLTISEGSTNSGHKLWGLTPWGLDAAAEVLPTGTEMGGTARGAARSGAKHAMAVNETIIAFLRPRPEPEPAAAAVPGARQPPADDAAGDTGAGGGEQLPDTAESSDAGEGIGSIYAVSTEAVHNLPATGRNKSSVNADAVLRAPEDGLPVLLIEVDRGTESAAKVAEKFERYQRFFRVTVKGQPVWRTLYPDTGREGYPPIALVLTGAASRKALLTKITTIQNLTGECWRGTYQRGTGYGEADDGYLDYSDAIPIIATTLEMLQLHGPRSRIWWRFGHSDWETLFQALENTDTEAEFTQRQTERRRRWEEERERREQQHQRELEERKDQYARQVAQQEDPSVAPQLSQCAGCGDPLHSRPADRWADDEDHDGQPPTDGMCPTCRHDARHAQPQGLFRSLFGRP